MALIAQGTQKNPVQINLKHYHRAYKEETILTQLCYPGVLANPNPLTLDYPGYTAPDHKGIDSYHKWGATIYATHDGIVSHLIDEGNVGGGVWIEISRDGRYSAKNTGVSGEQYKHLRRGSVVVALGQKVKAGDKLGIQGSTGNSNGEHLHYEVRRNGILVDPLNYIGITDIESDDYYEEYKNMLQPPKSKTGFMITAGIWRIEPKDLLARIKTVFTDAYLEPVTDMRGNKKYEIRVGRFDGTLANGNKFVTEANATFAFGLELWSQ